METVCLDSQLCALAINQFYYVGNSLYCSVIYSSLLLVIDYPKMEPPLGECYFSLLYTFLSPSISSFLVLLCFYLILKAPHFCLLKEFFRSNSYHSLSFDIIWFLCSLPQDAIVKFNPECLFLHSDSFFLKKMLP